MINAETTQNIASFCKAISDPLRIMILRVLLHNSFGVLELTQLFATTQSGMSHHLKILLQAALVVTRREGNSIFYRRALPKEHLLANLHQAALEEIDALSIPFELQKNIEQIYAERAESSKTFFANLIKNGELAQQDELIVGLAQYQDVLLTLLDHNIATDDIALEVGPGEGKFIPVLAKRFKQVIAVDNSAEMLQLVEKICNQQQLDNVNLQHADATKLQLADKVDYIVANMVLHHLPAPAEALKHFKSYLKATGRLLVTELCHHQQTWVTDACGDLWLGFEPDELDHWAEAAGFKSDESLYIGLRNGFQLQVKHFCVT